jgi:hypothetical protein
MTHPFIDYQEGNTNLLITAPHGGNKKPKDIPDRTYGKTYRDTYTRPLTYKLLELFPKDNKPYSIIANIHRKKVDLNRDIVEGAQGNYHAESNWYYWNYFLGRYRREILQTYNMGLHIDIHSHNNSDEFHLGYNLSKTKYKNVFKKKNTKGSTLDSLGTNLYEMLFGKYSLKFQLEKCQFSIFYPHGKDVYFNGGYNIETYSGNGFGGIQIEIPVSILKIKEQRYKIIDCLYESILLFRDSFVCD